jgi:transposase
VAPVQVTLFRGDRRYQILPAYTQEGVLLSRVFQGTTDSALYEDFIEQLLHHCGRWPEPKSVLVTDNASFHHSDRIEQMYFDAEVKLVHLPPYSLDLNPIEVFFSELKAFIKRHWYEYEENPNQDFGVFLEWCIGIAGGRYRSAEARFRHAGIIVEAF